MVGLLSLAALARLLGRRRTKGKAVAPAVPTTLGPPAVEAPTVPIAPEATIGERRADVHQQARAAIDSMRERPAAGGPDDA